MGKTTKELNKINTKVPEKMSVIMVTFDIHTPIKI